MGRLSLILLLGLCGCVPLQSLTQTPLHAYAPVVNDAVRWNADQAQCTKYARGYQRKFDVTGTVTDALSGGAANLSQVPLSPIAPAYGAAGAIGSDLLNDVGFLNADQQKVYVKCLDKLTGADSAALVFEPN